MSGSDAELHISAESEGVRAAMAEAASAVREGAEKMQESMEGFNKKIEKVMGGFRVFKEALMVGAAGEAFVEMAKKASEYADSIDRAAQKTGLSTDRMQELRYAAQTADIPFDALQQSMGLLSRKMAEAQQGSAEAANAFKSVGISTEQLSHMTLDEALAKISDKFHDSEDGANKSAVAMQLLGRSGADMIPFLNKGSEEISKLSAEARQMGLVLSKEDIEAGAHLDDQMKQLHGGMEAMTNLISIKMIPAFSAIVGAMNEDIATGGPFRQMIEAIADGIILLTKVVSTAVSTVIAFGKTIAAVIAIVANPSNAKNIFEQWKSDIDELDERNKKFMESLDHPRAADKPPVEEKKKGDLNLYGKASKDKSNKERMQLADEHINQIKAMNELELGAAAEKYKQAAAMGQISSEQQLQAQQAMEDRKFEIESQALQDRIALHAKEPVDRQKMLDELQQLESKHALEIIKINDQIELEKKKASDKRAEEQKKALDEETRRYEQMLSPISNAVDRSVQGMIMGTTTAKQAIANLGQSILAEFINMTVKKTTAWIAAELAQSAATKAASAQNRMTKVAEANTEISANAASAASGAAKSQSDIPIVGPAMAATSFASVMSMVLGAKSTVASAAGGYDIPAGINPLTQLHEKEMVLPAHIAQPLRDSLAGDGGGGGPVINYHDYSGQLTPAEIQKNVSHIARALKGYGRQFSFR
ncbi:hypothetical protein GALL_71440 [mine drainage metagenome]|uniref:Uncharacterized protein n=1 Tax=mine drainage metagenome TaxID=410659 RepID=A0A1J5T3Z0_9ZZZZ